MKRLQTNPARERSIEWHEFTGCYVRAFDSRGCVGNFDIAQLSADSLLAWLREQPGRAEQVVLMLLDMPR
jgi:hypothetical protein